MAELELKPIPIKSLPAPLLRSTPTIFEYARITAEAEVGSVVRRQFTAHLRALKAMLAVLVRGSDVSPLVVEPLIHRCESMSMLRGAELAASFTVLVEGLQTIYETDRKAVREALVGDPDLCREIFRAEVRPKRILAIYAEDTWDRSEKMKAKLVDRCWYDQRRFREGDGMVWLEDTDLVIFAPGKRSIAETIEEAVARAGLPVLVLAGWVKQADPQGMVELRLEHMYRQSGFDVLHGPFPPVRLYQTIDKIHLRHLARYQTTERRLEASAHEHRSAWSPPRFFPDSPS